MVDCKETPRPIEVGLKLLASFTTRPTNEFAYKQLAGVWSILQALDWIWALH